MGKRKRGYKIPTYLSTLTDTATIEREKERLPNNIPTIQIITGSYERILHGVTATILPQFSKDITESSQVTFVDTFLFNAHGSAIRCLAISPPSTSPNASTNQKAILASGGSDQIINLYQIATSPPPLQKEGVSLIPSLGYEKTAENPRNRELGSLQHHNSSLNALYFSTRSKLLSAAEDNTIAITRTRDWTVLSTIKAPIPKAHGRPSGDTAPLGGTPAGVNDFAIHPSMKLMVSVGKGEKCMRLWNLVTGKKAGVLSFERRLLQGIGEGRWGSGEGRKVRWNFLGEEFAVGFEKGAVVFGMDSRPKCQILPSPITKIHQLCYTEISIEHNQALEILAVSTEDGRILLYDTKVDSRYETGDIETKSDIPTLEALGQIGGIAANVTGRIKDFKILDLELLDRSSQSLIVVAGSSDGAIRLWRIGKADFSKIRPPLESDLTFNGVNTANNDASRDLTNQVGQLLGTYETGNRITCLEAFVMLNPIIADDAQSSSELNHLKDDCEAVDFEGITGS